MSAKSKYDVIVVGAGPAGSIASYYLSKNGYSVLLIEKEQLPRYKTCGGGLVYRARKIIPDFNVEIVEREFYAIDWSISNQNMHFKVNRPYPIITMVMRDRLDKHIVDASLKQGTSLLDNTKLQSLTINGNVVVNTSKGSFETKIVIGADGALSSTAKLAGFSDTRRLIPALEAEVTLGKDKFEEYSKIVRFDVDAMPKGYGWVFPKKNHLSIGIASELRGKVNLRDAYKKYLDYLKIEEISQEEIHGFQIPISSRKQLAGNRVLLTGDAAGLADPLVAEGISHALISGKIAADSIIKANLNWEYSRDYYTEVIRKTLIGQTRTGKILSKLFYHYPSLRKQVLSRKGERLTEYFTDVFSGKRKYPEGFVDISRAVLKTVF